MTAYIIRRLFWYPILLFGVVTVTLALGLYGPGDPAQIFLGKINNPEVVARIREQWGIDRPFPEQLFKYIGDILQGDFHESLTRFPGQKVTDLIAARLPVTMQINALALALGILLGVPLGIVAAIKHNRWLDSVISLASVAWVAIPVFAISPVLLWIFARELPLWTAATFGPEWRIGLPAGGWDGIFSTRAVLPMITLSPIYIAIFILQTRTGMIEALSQDYVRTARAKGLKEWFVVFKHAFRNALIPLVTLFGIMLAGIVGGAVIVEGNFGIPGIGQLMLLALGSRDYPIILAITLLSAVAYITLNLLVDIVYVFIDPRIRYR